MQLDVESLRTFAAVLDTGTMTAAAGELGLTQSAVSWKIKRLEERVGRQLLVRDGRSLRPSKDGEQLLDYARAMTALHDEAVARLSSSELTGQVRIGANEEISAKQLTDLLARFDRLHPRARIEFNVDQSLVLARQIDAGELDVAVFQVPPDELRPTDDVLWDDELCWVVSADAAPAIDPAGPVPLVSWGPSCCYRPLAHRALDGAGVAHRHAFSGTSTSSVVAAVIAGLGVSVLSRRLLDDSMIEWDPPFDLGRLPPMHQVVRHAKGPQAPIVDALVGELVTELSRI